MPKKKKYIEVNPTIVTCHEYTAEEHEQHYKRDYEFNKPVSARSPVRGWEDKYIRKGEATTNPKEVALVRGTPYSRKGVRLGNSYGNRPATRKVGKR